MQASLPLHTLGQSQISESERERNRGGGGGGGGGGCALYGFVTQRCFKSYPINGVKDWLGNRSSSHEVCKVRSRLPEIEGSNQHRKEDLHIQCHKQLVLIY